MLIHNYNSEKFAKTFDLQHVTLLLSASIF
jgi:hypothetical protein